MVGADSFGLSNRVVVDGGTLRAANAVGTASLDVRRGTNVLNSGLIDVDQLVITNKARNVVAPVFGMAVRSPFQQAARPPVSSTIAVAGFEGSIGQGDRDSFQSLSHVSRGSRFCSSAPRPKGDADVRHGRQ